VGTYGPHFSYVAPPDFFRLYHKKLSPPRSWQPETHDPNPLVDAKCQRTRVSFADNREEPVTTGIMLAARAAYYGMITEQDRLIGLVRDSWQAYLDRNRRQGVFVYSSDHGDTCGEHNLFGKQTFYEGSARIPLVFEGAGIRADHRIYGPVSIMDIGPTLCELAGSPPPPAQDGVSLAAHLQSGTDPDDRAVLSEWVQNFQEQPIPARMIRRNKWKLMHYHHESIPDRLFDIESDPDELYDCKGANPEIADAMLTSLQTDWKPQRVAQRFAEKQRHLSLVRRWYREIAPGEPPAELHRVPESCTRPPEIVV
jgi:choline-sulfatase